MRSRPYRSHVQRSALATSLRASSICRPHPVQVVLPHLAHVIGEHMGSMVPDPVAVLDCGYQATRPLRLVP